MPGLAGAGRIRTGCFPSTSEWRTFRPCYCSVSPCHASRRGRSRLIGAPFWGTDAYGLGLYYKERTQAAKAAGGGRGRIRTGFLWLCCQRASSSTSRPCKPPPLLTLRANMHTGVAISFCFGGTFPRRLGIRVRLRFCSTLDGTQLFRGGSVPPRRCRTIHFRTAHSASF